MTGLRKLFFETKMTWARVLIFAAAAGAVTALMLILPLTANTSLANMGVTPECWILFALIVIMNCEKPLEAGVKTFVFFLVSQPLIYLLQVPFSWQGWGIFQYYPRWFVWTLLCFPGAMIAWYVKKDTVLSALILSAATAFLGVLGVDFAAGCVRNFPKNLLSVIFIAALIAVLILTLLKSRKNRLIAAAVTLAAVLAMCAVTFGGSGGTNAATSCYLGGDGGWEVAQVSGDIGEIRIDPENDSFLLVKGERPGSAVVTVTNAAGETQTLTVSYDEETGVSADWD